MPDIFQYIKKLGREILVYVIPGLVFAHLLFFLFFDFIGGFYTHTNWLSLLVSGYVVGHVLNSFRVLESRVRENFDSSSEAPEQNDISSEVQSFMKNDKAYDYFVERYSDLNKLRSNFSVGFGLISALAFFRFLFTIAKL
jgi:hypothetical protein